MIEDHELDAIEIESNHTIEIDSSCRAARSTNASSTAPIASPRTNRSARVSFAVIREAMRGKLRTSAA